MKTDEFKSTLIPLVKQEAENIKLNATKREINRLKIKSLDPANIEQCIYGQMTGSCYSKRANQLVRKCATKVYKPMGNTNPLGDVVLSDDKVKVAIQRESEYHSPIEIFIYHFGYCDGTLRIDKTGNIKKIINYLKGETKTLTLK